MKEAAIPISILLGFAILGAAIHTKENDFDTCVRLYREHLPEQVLTDKGQIVLIRECTGQ
jgi:hypothetical protein